MSKGKITDSELSVDLQNKIKLIEDSSSLLKSMSIYIKSYEQYVTNGDWTLAFKEAYKNAPCTVYVPKGTFDVTKIRIPSNCSLVGSGFSTIINAIKGDKIDTIISNENLMDDFFDYSNPNPKRDYNIVIKNILVKGNSELVTSGLASINAKGSGISISNAENVIVENVRVENPVLHCFDTMADRPYQLLVNYGHNQFYNENKRSKFIIFKNCEGILAGDDTFTQHYSDYIYCINCRAYGNRLDFSGSENRNGFEVDDGTKNIFYSHCYATGNARGYEIKAHEHSPAPENIVLESCVAEKTIIGFHARHLMHHLAAEPISNGKNVTFDNCQAINQINLDGFETLSPQALQISAFNGVVINNFKAIGGEDNIVNSVIATQYKCRNVTFNNLIIDGFSAANDLNIVGSDQRCDNITVNNATIKTNSKTPIGAGYSIQNISFKNINIIGTGRADSVGMRIYSNSNGITFDNINIEGTNQFIVKNIDGVEVESASRRSISLDSLSKKVELFKGKVNVGGTSITLNKHLDYFDYLIFEIYLNGDETRIIDLANNNICYIKGINMSNSVGSFSTSIIEMKINKVDTLTLLLEFNFEQNLNDMTIKTENGTSYYIKRIVGIKY